jgi:ribosome-associated toxin RatA of RatAB toxin-antitoxin module
VSELTEGSIRIEAAPADVLRVITDFAGYPEWAEGVRAAEVVESDDRDRPIRVAFRVGMAGIDAAYTLAYTYASGTAGVSWTTEEASGAVTDIEGEYGLEPDGDATLVTYRLRVEPAIPLPGFLKRHAERTIVDTALKGLKARVEEA